MKRDEANNGWCEAQAALAATRGGEEGKPMNTPKTIMVWDGQQGGMSASPGRKYHLAKLITAKGHVSPLCAHPKPRRLDMKKETWTIRHEAVTCKKCLAIIKTHSVQP